MSDLIKEMIPAELGNCQSVRSFLYAETQVLFEEKSERSQLLPGLDCQNHLYCIASYEFGNKLLPAGPLCISI